MTTKSDLKDTEFSPYHGIYINKLEDRMELREGFETGKQHCIQFFESIPEDKLNYRYAPEKWNSKEIFQHIIDAERIFMYRCFRIARNDKTPLAGFDQDVYILPSNATHKTREALIDEYNSVRQSFISLLNSLDDEQLHYMGTASGEMVSARAIAFVTLGHERWHIDIIKERYL